MDPNEEMSQHAVSDQWGDKLLQTLGVLRLSTQQAVSWSVTALGNGLHPKHLADHAQLAPSAGSFCPYHVGLMMKQPCNGHCAGICSLHLHLPHCRARAGSSQL